MINTTPPAVRDAIRRAYAEHGSIAGAARAVGVSWGTANRYATSAVADPNPPAPAAPIAAAIRRLDPAPGAVPADPDAILARLRKADHSTAEVAAWAGIGADDAARWLESRRAAGVNLRSYDGPGGPRWAVAPAPVVAAGPVTEIVSDDDDTFTIGAMGDTHLCSKYERLDVLHDLYDGYAAAGVRDVFHTGNWIDGEARFNRFDLKVHGMDAQLSYLAQEYPRRPGITTHAVAGDDHEGWYCQATGVDIGRYAEIKMRDAGRDDWRNLGYMEAFVRLVNRRSGAAAMMAVVHPGGGSAYALSYTVQKIVESYAGGEKPAVLLVGHYHKMELAVFRNVFCVQTGCTEDQTPFMRKKRLEAHVGGHTLRLKQDPATGAIVEMNGMRRYFNTGYYNDRWSHSGPVNLPRRTPGGV